MVTDSSKKIDHTVGIIDNWDSRFSIRPNRGLVYTLLIFWCVPDTNQQKPFLVMDNTKKIFIVEPNREFHVNAPDDCIFKM